MNHTEGLWALKRNLVVDPRTAQFAPRCLFTDEPVTEMTMMTLAQVEASKFGPVMTLGKQQTKMLLPISDGWRRSMADRCSRIRAILLAVGFLFVALGIAIPLWMGMEGDRLGSTISVALGFGILSVIVGVALPYLDDMNGSKYLSGVRFLNDGRLLIPNVHENVTKGLPELKEGFLHGLLGKESLKEAG